MEEISIATIEAGFPVVIKYNKKKFEEILAFAKASSIEAQKFIYATLVTSLKKIRADSRHLETKDFADDIAQYYVYRFLLFNVQVPTIDS